MNTGIPIEVPRVNANEDAVEVLKCYAEDGARVEAGELVVDLGTSKASIGVESPAAGILVLWHAEGATVAVGETLGWIARTEDEVAAARALKPSGGVDAGRTDAGPEDAPRSRLSKSARRFLEARGLDPNAVNPGGLVSSRRAQRLIDGDTRVELDWIKRAEVKALDRASDVLASSVTMTAPLSTRLSGMVSRLAFIVCQTAQLLRRYPVLNAHFDDGAIMHHGAVHVGVAMDMDQGLRVVTVRDAGSLSEDQAEQALIDLTLRYLEGTLQPDDMSDSTFTVTDLSSFGVTSFQPRINEYQAAILGVGAGADPGSLTLTLVFDHRVTNGRIAAMFLSDLRDALREGEGAPVTEQRQEFSVPDKHCDRCGIALEDYFEQHARDAVMTVTARPDGTLGLLCHVCGSGVF